jgi:dTDP-4-amino-4,6-dideoxygalactose transaminase
MLWETYHNALKPLEDQGLLRRPVVPADCVHNAHMYYILLSSQEIRNYLMGYLKECGIHSVFHYVPLHSSKMGRKVGRGSGDLSVTDDMSGRLLRLPFWLGVEAFQEEVVHEIGNALIGR